MSDLIREFELACEAANVAPSAALRRAGLSPSTWFRWKANAVSPTLRSFDAARAGLATIIAERGEADSQTQAVPDVSLGKIGALP